MVESRTKLKLSGQELETLVRHAFGQARLSAAVELTEGFFNTAYRLDIDGLGPLVLKVAPPPGAEVLTYEIGLMRTEVEAMRLVSADPDVPAPRVRHADFTRRLLPADHFFMDAVEGEPWSRLRDELDGSQNAEIERQLGRITARVNRVEHPTFGYPGVGPAFRTWSEAFGWMCRTLYADARRFSIDPPLAEAELLAHLESHRADLDEVATARLVHWDLWAGNVFVRLDDGAPVVSGVIDFERAIWGDPLMEFIPGRLREVDAYLEGYGEDLLATRAQRMRRVLYNVYLGLVLVIEDGPRRYTDKSTVEWGRGLIERGAAMLRHGGVIEGLTRYA